MTSDTTPALRLTYPPELPVSARRDDLLRAIAGHQVIVVAGDTGSGKTTQLPKMCLELGRGASGRLIGHTQPRRIAARAVADRLAEELGVELGAEVGFQVRFSDQVSAATRVKVMTDGILLAEIQRDRQLRRYDTIIIDEAHERSLNIDFLIGYLARLLPSRPDLKVIITSATIDTDKFAAHFGGAPVIEVTGRTYPVEVRYRPAESTADEVQDICDAVAELQAQTPGDILVFLSGEREIRDAADALGRVVPPGTEILPLYARLSAAEQHRVFAPHPGRRVVLSTNVAETSLTVPGITAVVDTGVARMSRYSNRLKVQRLPIEPVSRASADQRAGRCGRVAPGICIRLYSEDDYLARPAFTEPEVLRTNLASVLLQMASLGLGDVARFPFVDPPDSRSIASGVQLLEEIGAFTPAEQDPGRRLTKLGRRLARLPLDPRLARMVIEAERGGCLHDVLVITAALSIQDPRERPAEHQQAADAMHRRFADPHSDFTSYLSLWRYLRDRQKELSSGAFRRMCRDEFLHYLRIREWQDLVSQLRQVASELGMQVSTRPAESAAVHQALMSGLLSHVGMRDQQRRDYLGARGARFAIWPGSSLGKSAPTWVMAAELVETSRLWARVVARVDPLAVERMAEHLVVRSYSEPHWSKRSAAVMARERVTLYGVPLVANRRVAYGRIDPGLCRELFIRHALVQGEWDTHHQVVRRNRELLDSVEELEHRARRRDLVVDEEALVEFYDRRLPDDIVSGRHFDAWWKQARRQTPDLLTLTEADLVRGDGISDEDFPTTWSSSGGAVDLTYRFEPGADDDGVTAHIPLTVLHQVSGDDLDRLVQGYRLELVTALLRTLPKQVRTRLVPASDVATRLLPRLSEPSGASLVAQLASVIARELGVEVEPGQFRPDAIPDHLRMTFSVEEADGTGIAVGKDLDALKASLADRIRGELASIGEGIERSGLTAWPDTGVPRTVQRQSHGSVVTGYPALVDEGASGVALRVLGSAREQADAMRAGLRRLLRMTSPVPASVVTSGLSNAAKLALARNPHGSVGALVDDCTDAIIDEVLDVVAPERDPSDKPAFDHIAAAVRSALPERLPVVLRDLEPLLAAWWQAQDGIASLTAPRLAPARDDMTAQASALVHPHLVRDAGLARLPDVCRYLRGIVRRAARAAEDPARDLIRLEEVESVMTALADAQASTSYDAAALAQVRWQVEELRISLFAQDLGARGPVSRQRILRAIAAARLP